MLVRRSQAQRDYNMKVTINRVNFEKEETSTKGESRKTGHHYMSLYLEISCLDSSHVRHVVSLQMFMYVSTIDCVVILQRTHNRGMM